MCASGLQLGTEKGKRGAGIHPEDRPTFPGHGPEGLEMGSTVTAPLLCLLRGVGGIELWRALGGTSRARGYPGSVVKPFIWRSDKLLGSLPRGWTWGCQYRRGAGAETAPY
jgi:hypothetical protein